MRIFCFLADSCFLHYQFGHSCSLHRSAKNIRGGVGMFHYGAVFALTLTIIVKGFHYQTLLQSKPLIFTSCRPCSLSFSLPSSPLTVSISSSSRRRCFSDCELNISLSCSISACKVLIWSWYFFSTALQETN